MKQIFIIAALICFCLKAVGAAARIEWQAAGFAFLTATLLV
jgi:hypothetical protein